MGHEKLEGWRNEDMHEEAERLRREPQFQGSVVRVEHTRAGTPEIVIRPKPEEPSH